MALERGGIFAVRVDHDDMALGRLVADAVHDQGGGGRLAGAGRAEQREMLAEQGIDIERAAHVLGRIDGADLDMGALVGGEHLLQIVAGDRIGLAAGDRIGGDAALEIDQLAGRRILVALAEEIDLGADRARFGVDHLQAADVGEQPAPVRGDLDLAADLAGHGDAGIGIVWRARRGGGRRSRRGRRCRRSRRPGRSPRGSARAAVSAPARGWMPATSAPSSGCGKLWRFIASVMLGPPSEVNPSRS